MTEPSPQNHAAQKSQGAQTDVDLVLRGRVLTDDGILLRRVVVSGGRVVTIESVSDWSDTELGVAEVVLADDEVLVPGLVDTHVHVNEPGRTEWEGFASATRAAAAGGVTTVLDMPLNSIPATTSVAALAAKRAVADGQCSVDVGFWGGAVPESLGHLTEMWEAGAFGFKCFLLDSGVPEFPPLSAAQLREAMIEIAAFDGILVVHAEDPEVIAAHGMGPSRTYDDFLASCPPEAETTAIGTVVDAARETGCRAHVVHLSAAEALPEIVAARAEGVRLSVEACPHYLTLGAESVPDGQTQFKCCPPVRGETNADLLWRALQDGGIDCVVSDHSPCTLDLKGLDVGDFGAAWGGISSLQLGLALVWTEAQRRGIDLATVVGWMSAAPARVVGVDRRGHIAVGAPADFAVFAPEERWTVRAADLQHRNAITPYEGREVTGRVRRTYLDGVPVEDALLESLEWTTLVERAPCEGDTENSYAVASDRRWTHVRLSIHPDGGVARFRVHGEVVLDPRFLTTTVDLLALENGGRLLDTSDAFYASPENLILPSRAPGSPARAGKLRAAVAPATTGPRSRSRPVASRPWSRSTPSTSS